MAEFDSVLGGSEGIDEALERGDGGVDLEDAGGDGLRSVTLPRL